MKAAGRRGDGEEDRVNNSTVTDATQRPLVVWVCYGRTPNVCVKAPSTTKRHILKSLVLIPLTNKLENALKIFTCYVLITYSLLIKVKMAIHAECLSFEVSLIWVC